ncbi:SGNH/GDSL hydrolase family protein [Paenibacillus oryzisoli]|uniref:SGNH/GDSL hydrolase family protein n=1 Tax=Paenibacillus oryzisoli TaxID=1850517 RepID=UPI003D29AD12
MTIPSKKILFQGDSITDVGRNKEVQEPNRHLGSGYVTMIAGKLGAQYTDAEHQVYNRGISGNRVSDLYARWNEDAISIQPDILSILIGVNDAWRMINKLPQGASDRFERVYRHLLEETAEVMPQTKLVLCEPFVLPAGTVVDNWEQWQGMIPHYGQIVRTLAEEFDAVFVELQEPFNQALSKKEAGYWLHDGVHATAAGHELIAEVWMQAVRKAHLL